MPVQADCQVKHLELPLNRILHLEGIVNGNLATILQTVSPIYHGCAHALIPGAPGGHHFGLLRFITKLLFRLTAVPSPSHSSHFSPLTFQQLEGVSFRHGRKTCYPNQPDLPRMRACGNAGHSPRLLTGFSYVYQLWYPTTAVPRRLLCFLLLWRPSLHQQAKRGAGRSGQR